MAKISVVTLKVRAYHRACFKQADRGTEDRFWGADAKSITTTWSDLIPEGISEKLPALPIKDANKPSVPDDLRDLFPSSSLRVLLDTTGMAEFPDIGFTYTGDWFVGSCTQGAKAAWPYDRVRERVMEHLTSELLGAGTPREGAPDLPSSLKASALGLEGHDRAVLAGHKLREAVLAAVAERFRDTGTGYTLTMNDAEPTVVRNQARNGHDDVVTTSSESAILVETKGTGFVDALVKVFAVEDANGKLTLHGVLPEGLSDASDAARSAAEAWDESYKRAFVQKVEGRTVDLPSTTRPAATLSPDLSQNERDHYDSWWNRNLQLINALQQSPVRTEAEGWSDYVANGGSLNREEWNAQAASRQDAAAAIPNSDFLSGLGTALGWTGDKVVDGVAWIGKSVLDLLKTWGPTGTLQVYGGVKAVDAVTGPSFEKYLPWMLGGAALLLLLR